MMKMMKPGRSCVAAAVGYMTLANALHFGAYELARSAIMALFTSDNTGFANTAAVTLSTGLVSPFAVAVLYAHRRVFDRHGPRRSLLYTTIAYAVSMSMTAVVLRWCATLEQQQPMSDLPKRISQCWIVFLFVAKNAFVQLLTAQHWSFLTTVLLSSSSVPAGATWTPVIAGIASVAATAAGWLVSPLVGILSSRPTTSTMDNTNNSNHSNNDGLTGLLLVASAVMMLTSYCSDEAYRIAQEVRHWTTTVNTTTTAIENSVDDQYAHYSLACRTTLRQQVKPNPQTEIPLRQMCRRRRLCKKPCNSFAGNLFWKRCALKF
jgi:hypothetical protein